MGKNRGDVRLHFFGAEAGVDERVLPHSGQRFGDRRACARRCGRLSRALRAMEGEGDAAIRAFARFAAVAAEQRGGKAAAIEKEDCLLLFLEPLVDRAAQLLGQNRGRLFLPPFLPQIDDPDQRHLALIDPLGQRAEQSYLPCVAL